MGEPITTPLRDRFLKPRINTEGKGVSTERTNSPSMDNRNTVNSWPAWIALFLNIGGMLVFGGMFIQRLSSVESSQRDDRAAQQVVNQTVARHEVELAVTNTKLDSIQRSVTRIEQAVTKP